MMLGLTVLVLTGWAGFLTYVTNETKVTSSVVKQILRTIKTDPQLLETLGLAIRPQPEWWLNGYPIIHGQVREYSCRPAGRSLK
jgi:cytochrome c oxidase assembly factor 1